MITQAQLKEIFNYVNGELYWKVRPSNFVDLSKPAGSINNDGYRSISVRRERYQAHRLVYIYHHGFYPIMLDHINNNRSDNRIENLREATARQNGMNKVTGSNNTSGVKGVHFCKSTKKWKSVIRSNGKRLTIGYFTNISDAKDAVTGARRVLHGEFANDG